MEFALHMISDDSLDDAVLVDRGSLNLLLCEMTLH